MSATIIVSLVSTGDAFAAAHARLIEDSTFQFAFERPPPDLSKPPPPWLIDLLRLIGTPLAWIAPYAGWVVGGLLAVGVCAIVGAVAWDLFRRPPALAGARTRRATPEAWRPDPVRARLILGDADQLAAEGRYADAARLILRRSISDIDKRRPNLVVPSHTSRDIAALEALPDPARSAFALIARHVESGLFALRPLDAAAFAECRRAYADFALPTAWARA